MNSWNKQISLFIITICLMLLVSACSGGNNTTNMDPGNTESSGVEITADGKYEKPIELTSVMVNYDVSSKLPEGDSPENNAWTRTYKDELGINVSYLWTSPSDKGEEKMNLSIASNDLPDVLPLTRNQFAQLSDAGKLADLTDVIEQYASESVKKQLFAESNKKTMEAITVDGKIYGIPFNLDYTEFSTMMWIRQDWLDHLGLEDPKTIEEINKVAEAFMTQDVDGKGNKAKYGVAFHKDFVKMSSFWNAFHVYPNIWVEDEETGDLVDGTYLPGNRDALLQLQQWYKSGVIPKDFGAMDGAKSLEDLNSGKVGILFGGLWDAWGTLSQGKDNDPSIEWKVLPIPSVDNNPALVSVPSVNINTVYSVREDYEHPEALILMLNKVMEKMWESNDPEVSKKHLVDGTFSPYVFSMVFVEPLAKNYKTHLDIVKALETNDPSKLTVEAKGYYDSIVKYREGDNSQWYLDMSYGPNASTSMITHYLENNSYKLDEYLGLPTPTLIENKPFIDDEKVQTYTKIIMGEDISEYDAFIESANSLGQTKITKEVNEWTANNK